MLQKWVNYTTAAAEPEDQESESWFPGKAGVGGGGNRS